jgi:hypothetical protein
MPVAKPQGAVRKSRKRSRRSRTDSIDIVDQYEALYNRVSSHTRAETINQSFSDKELRILMGQNKLLINNFDPATGKYTEKTKLQKAETLLTIIGEMVEPAELRVALPKPQRSSTRPVRRPTTNDFKSSSDSDSSESSESHMPEQARVQQRSNSSGGIRGTGRPTGSSNGRTKGSRKGAKKNTPQHRRSEISLSPTPSWPQQHLDDRMLDGPDSFSSSAWSSAPDPDFSIDEEPIVKPPPAVCRAVARATMAAAEYAEAAARAKMKMYEDSTPDNDMSPGSMPAHLEMQHRMQQAQQMEPMHGRGADHPMHMMSNEGYGAPTSSLSGGLQQYRHGMPAGQMPLSAWSEFSRAGVPHGSQQQRLMQQQQQQHRPTQPRPRPQPQQQPQLQPQPQQLHYQLKPMQSHHLTQPQQQASHSPVETTHTRSPLQPPILELDSSVPPEAPWNVSDSLTSPIPPLIYSDDCQLNEVDEEPGSARVPLEETTNSPKSQHAANLAAELEREVPLASLDEGLAW